MDSKKSVCLAQLQQISLIVKDILNCNKIRSEVSEHLLHHQATAMSLIYKTQNSHLQRFLPSDLFLQLGAEQQISEEENVPQLPGALHQLHHETVPQQLTAL